MERLTVGWAENSYDTFDPIDIVDNEYSKINYEKVLTKLGQYEDAEEQGLLVKIECHCKDCKHVDFAGCKNKTCYCIEHECYMQEDDFCKYAERYKEEAEQMKGV